VFLDVPAVPTNGKLRDKQGRTVRIQETSLHEAFELWHRYCDPKCLGLDLCTGTGVSIMAMLHLGLQGIVNERDKECLLLGVQRARNFMDHLYKDNKYQYPPLGQRHFEAHDGKDLYAWAGKCLGRGKPQPETTLQLPPTNHPYDVPNPMDDVAFEQVLMSGCVGWCNVS
jgi:hypothetical protein